MADQRNIATEVLRSAAKAVGTDRGQQHGDADNSFKMIAELWSTHINHAILRATGLYPMPAVHLSAWDVAQMMTQVKQGRAMYGDRQNPDHYIDAAGYTGLAAMLGQVYIASAADVAENMVAMEAEKAKVASGPGLDIPPFLLKDKVDAANAKIGGIYQEPAPVTSDDINKLDTKKNG